MLVKFLVLPQIVYWMVYVFMRSVVGLDPAWAGLVAFAPTFAFIVGAYLTEVRRRDRVDE